MSLQILILNKLYGSCVQPEIFHIQRSVAPLSPSVTLSPSIAHCRVRPFKYVTYDGQPLVRQRDFIDNHSPVAEICR